jgi:hypothetical protein
MTGLLHPGFHRLVAQRAVNDLSGRQISDAMLLGEFIGRLPRLDAAIIMSTLLILVLEIRSDTRDHGKVTTELFE